MGLTAQSSGINSLDAGLVIQRESPETKVIALSGNPNVGKSTVFNALTGMNQHTGNWPGKTVSNAQGRCRIQGKEYIMVDIPGTYSLLSHSTEEEVARDFICFGGTDAVIVVCDATCLERNLNLVLQTIEITPHVVVCLNLMDEAKKKRISIDVEELEQRLGVPVVATSARSGKGLQLLMQRVDEVLTDKDRAKPHQIRYSDEMENALSMIQPAVEAVLPQDVNSRWMALRLLEYDESMEQSLRRQYGAALDKEQLTQAVARARSWLEICGCQANGLPDQITTCIVHEAEEIAGRCVHCDKDLCDARDRRIDRILTSKRTGVPVMILLLALIFWLTITGANYPSQLLSDALFWVQDRLTELFTALHAPDWLHGALVLGVYRVLAWVVSVMLPPMAIFFPLFTLLEDLGYLPRVAFNLDKYFKKAHACGKQALTMCME